MSTLARVTLGRLRPPSSGGGSPAGVVGGFIKAQAAETIRAVAEAGAANASAASSPVRATMIAVPTARPVSTITATVQPSPITAELPNG